MATRKFARLDDRFTIQDVGSTLLDDLAKGLYQPEAVIREYVQNAVDAHRQWQNDFGTDPGQPIQIEIRGDRISILDYGIGMDEKDIRKVKSIAVSDKRNSEVRLTGYKGVGIWAGLSYFQTLELFSTKRGEKRGYKLTIKFKNIVDAISEQSSIGDVLNGDGKNPNYFIEVCDADEDEHLAEVTLISPTRSSEWFLDEGNIRSTVQRICPCEIDPTFALYRQLTEWYRGEKTKLFPIVVAGKPVYRSYASSVEDFNGGTITFNDVVVAKYWLAINADSSRGLPEKEDQLRGFRIVHDGFTLGPPNPYSDSDLPPFDSLSQSVTRYLNWYIGEIHIVDNDLKPNLARDKFEESDAAKQFIRRIRDWYVERDTYGRAVSKKRNLINDVYVEYEARLNEYLEKGAPIALDEDEFTYLLEMQKELEKQEQIAKSKKDAAKTGWEMIAFRDNDVKTKRKQLIALIAKITPKIAKARRKAQRLGMKTSPAFGTAPKPGAATSSAKVRPTQPNTPDLPGPPVTQGEVDSNGNVLGLEVVISLLREILSDEIPDKAEAIISKLLTRINSLS